MNKPQIVAHRGASGYAPETTLEAYRIALEASADFVEVDVHQARDGAIVGIHDPDVKRTTNGRGRIADLTLPELKALDAGSWFNRKFPKKARQEFTELKVPTLQEVVALIKGRKTGAYIEIKNPELYSPDFESSLVAVVKDNGFENRALFLSFNPQSLVKTKQFDDSIPTALLISRLRKNTVQAALGIGADELAIRYDIASPEIVDAAHENGLSVSVWAVDKPSDLRRMIDLGVDRIITNYPDRPRELL